MRAQPIVVLPSTPSGGLLICLPLRLHGDQPQRSIIRIQINKMLESRDDSCCRCPQRTCTVPVDGSGPETTAARRLDSRWGERERARGRWRCLTQAVRGGRREIAASESRKSSSSKTIRGFRCVGFRVGLPCTSWESAVAIRGWVRPSSQYQRGNGIDQELL